MAGPLLARTGHAVLGQPGGNSIGWRRVDTHLLALKALGVSVRVEGDQYFMRVDRLRGADIFLDEASVTGTEQAILASVFAEGQATIVNAASEPHVQDLCRMLNCLGAKIDGIGSNTLIIDGVSSLHGGEHTIMSDHIEIGSFIGLAAVTGGELLIRRAGPQHMKMTCLVFNKLGVKVEVRGEDMFVPGGQELKVAYDMHDATQDRRRHLARFPFGPAEYRPGNRHSVRRHRADF